MKVVVAGCGKIGTSVVASLREEDHDIVLIDKRSDVLSEISNEFDIMTICGNCVDINTLSAAGVDDCELFIAVTSSDETNMLACCFAKELGANNTLARVRDTEYDDNALKFITDKLAINFTLNPEKLLAKEIARTLYLPTAAKVEVFSSSKIEMIELHLKEGSALNGLSLIDLASRTKAKFNICAVQRGEDVFIPTGGFILKDGDIIGVTATKDDLSRLLKDMKFSGRHKSKNVLIFGGSRTSYYLAKELFEFGCSVTIIEKDEETAKYLDDVLLGKAKILQLDGSRKEALYEAGLKQADAFVSLTGFDEENILVSFFSSDEGVAKVVTKVNSYELSKTARKLGLDTVVNPKDCVSDIVIRYARGISNSLDTKVETLYSLMESKVEALEFTAGTGFSGLGTPIKDLSIKKDIIFAGIVRNRKTIIPRGDDCILEGDSVVIVTTQKHIDNLNSVLKSNH